MKVIFRIKKPRSEFENNYEYMNYAVKIRDTWNEVRDLGCMVVSEDVEVFVVDDDSEAIVEVIDEG